MTDIVERIDKLIKGWEREYGITNQTMVDAKDTIIRLRSGPGGIMEMKQTIADKENELNECNLAFNAQVEENYLQSLDIERLETEIDGLRKLLDLVYKHDCNLLDHLRGWK